MYCIFFAFDETYCLLIVLLFFTEALKIYRGKLTAFEQTEILDYPEIWFLGLEGKKIEGEPGSAQNNGYDDENGSYVKVGEIE